MKQKNHCRVVEIKDVTLSWSRRDRQVLLLFTKQFSCFVSNTQWFLVSIYNIEVSVHHKWLTIFTEVITPSLRTTIVVTFVYVIYTNRALLAIKIWHLLHRVYEKNTKSKIVSTEFWKHAHRE